tara:strand:+ start:27690 stop:27860 length:171 start_codon:yes stop_codon:yes gene_type:complete
MSKTTYKLKDIYKDASIAPNVIVVKLSELSQKQIASLVEQGYGEYFEEVKAKKSSK